MVARQRQESAAVAESHRCESKQQRQYSVRQKQGQGSSIITVGDASQTGRGDGDDGSPGNRWPARPAARRQSHGCQHWQHPCRSWHRSGNLQAAQAQVHMTGLVA